VAGEFPRIDCVVGSVSPDRHFEGAG